MFIVSVFLCLRCCPLHQMGNVGTIVVLLIFSETAVDHNNEHGIRIGHEVGHLSIFHFFLFCHSLSTVASSIDTTKNGFFSNIQSSQFIIAHPN